MQAEQLKDLVVNALEEVKAQDISVIDVPLASCAAVGMLPAIISAWVR